MSKDNPFDNEVEQYEEWFKSNNNIFTSELKAIKQLMPVSGQGIEIGVGTGIFASRLGIGIGVEPSDSMAAVAIKRGINVIKAHAEKLPINDRSYSFALMVTIDCFLENVSQALSEARRIIMDRGYLVIAFLDRDTPLGALYEKNKHLHESYKNANFHSAQDIMNLLLKAGFVIEDKRQTVYSLENEVQDIRNGVGEGLFAVMKAKKV